MKSRHQKQVLTFFKKNDPVLYPHVLMHYETVVVSSQRKTNQELFVHLVRSVVSQQLSTKAAHSIWLRLETSCKDNVTPEALGRMRTATLRKAGLSNAKCKTLKELSHAVLTEDVNFKKLRTIPEEEAVTSLSSVWGIGRWTAEMFLMFALETPDVFSAGDLGLIRSMESLYGIPKDSPRTVYEKKALEWSPYRTIASRILWKVRDTKK